MAGVPPPAHPRQIDTTPISPLCHPQLYLLYIPTPKSPRLIIFAIAKEKSRKLRRHIYMRIYVLKRVKLNKLFFIFEIILSSSREKVYAEM